MKAFLPQLEQANNLLGDNVDIEDVDEDGEYIEMNLGLGVLEEKTSTDSEESDSEEENVFDKLLRRTTEPGRKDLISDYDAKREVMESPRNSDGLNDSDIEERGQSAAASKTESANKDESNGDDSSEVSP